MVFGFGGNTVGSVGIGENIKMTTLPEEIVSLRDKSVETIFGVRINLKYDMKLIEEVKSNRKSLDVFFRFK